MTDDELVKYRESIDKQTAEKYKDFDTNISFIIIGALGFFITMLDKFVDVKTSPKFILVLMVLSFLSLIISFYYFLYNKMKMAKDSADLICFIDDDMKGRTSDLALNQELLKKWEKASNSIDNLRKKINWSLFFGVTFEVLFFVLSLFFSNKRELKPETHILKIEILSKDSIIKPKNLVILDSIK